VLSRHGFAVVALVLLPLPAAAQEVPPAPTAPQLYTPPSASDRVNWVVEGTLSLPVIAVNAADSAWSTHVNWPREWGRGALGFSKRFADEEAFGTVSNSIEAGLGSFWGEDPRYRRAGEGSLWRRVHHAVMATVLAPRRDGHLAPAWARFAAEGGALQIENVWLPPSARTPNATAWRLGGDMAFRAMSNVWDEFWPDVRKRIPARMK
jgi:hypothetical protein